MSGQYQARLTVISPSLLAEELRGLRDRACYLVREVAAGTGIDSALLSKIENGKRPPTQPQLAAIAKFFQVPLAPMEARRVAEEMKRRFGDSPEFAAATTLLHEEASEYRVNKTSAPVSNRVKPVNKPGK